MKNFTNLLLTIFILSFSQNAKSQLSSGSNAPDFTLDDIFGTSHNLYSYLANGQGAILDFSATWCGPCWNYHHNGILDAIYNNYGPGGTNQMQVFMIEADPGTTQPCIYGPAGCSGGSIGDWTAGTPYPILNPPAGGASNVNNAYNINFFPTLYAVGPNYKVYLVGQASYGTWENWVESFSLTANFDVSGDICLPTKQIDLQPLGGFGNLSFNWSNGATTEDIIVSTSGNYYVTITDGNGYDVEIGPISVGTSQNLQVQLDGYGDVLCFGDQNGFLDVSTTGGIGQLDYYWSNGANTEDIYDLEGGNYSLTVTDLTTGCEGYAGYTVLEYPPLESEVITSNSGCDDNSGTAEIIVDGGRPFYRYYFDGSYLGSNEITNLSAGTYDVQVEDANGCIDLTSFTIEPDSIPEADLGQLEVINCYHPVIQVDADSSSSGPNYYYNWYEDDTTQLGIGYMIDIDQSRSYYLEVIDSISGCADTLDFEILEDVETPESTVMAEGTLDCAVIEVQINSEILTETENVVFEWSTVDGNITSDPNQESITAAGEGSYIFTVTDTLNGCADINEIELVGNYAQPDIQLAELGQIDCNASQTSIEVNYNGEYSYSWSTSDGIIDSQNDNIVNVSSPGTYDLVATNMTSSCTTTESYTVIESTDLPEVNVESNEIITCMNSNSLVAVNYVDGYIYNWSSEDLDFETTTSANEIMVTEPGEYLVEVINSENGCVRLQAIQVEGDFELPEAALENIADINCNSSMGLIEVAEEANYTYEWTSLNGEISGATNESTIAVSSPGDYILYLINESNGCSTEYSYEVIEDIETPDVEVLLSSNIDCANSEAAIIVTDVDGYTYEWSDAMGNTLDQSNTSNLYVDASGMYTVLITNPENGCSQTLTTMVEAYLDLPQYENLEITDYQCATAQGAIGVEYNDSYSYSWTTTAGMIISGDQSNELLVGSVGNYQLQIMDNSTGCVNQFEFTVESNEEIPEFDLIETVSICAGELVDICSQGDAAQFTWYQNGIEIGTGSCFTLEEGGIYELVAMGANGCTFTRSTELIVNELPISNILASGMVNCNNPMVDLQAEMINAGYSYSWSDSNGQVLGNMPQISVTEGGEYTLSVLSENGCESLSTITVDEDPLTVANASFTFVSDELTINFENTTVEEYDNIIWNFGDGNVSSADHPQYSFDQAGWYTVCVTVGNACGETTVCEDILAAFALSVDAELSDVLCNGDENGSIAISIFGGLDNYEVEWNGPNDFESDELEIDNLSPGIYDLEVEDESGLTFETTYEIKEPAVIMVDAVVTSSDLDEKGTIFLETVSGGTAPYEYQWSNGDSDVYIFDLNPGDYTVVITDANGCEHTETYTVDGITNVNEIESLNSFVLAPNPANDFINLELIFDEVSQVEVSILNMKGQLIEQERFEINRLEKQFDLQNFQNGIYLMMVRNENQISLKKFEVIR